MRAYTTLTILLLLFSHQAVAAMYKWVDENGTIVYSQKQPPAGATLLKTPPLPKSRLKSGQNPSPQQQETSSMQPGATQGQETTSTGLTEEQQKQYREQCEKLRKNLQILMEPKRIYVTTKEGNRHYLNDAEREEKILKINEQLPRYCKEY